MCIAGRFLYATLLNLSSMHICTNLVLGGRNICVCVCMMLPRASVYSRDHVSMCVCDCVNIMKIQTKIIYSNKNCHSHNIIIDKCMTSNHVRWWGLQVDWFCACHNCHFVFISLSLSLSLSLSPSVLRLWLPEYSSCL